VVRKEAGKSVLYVANLGDTRAVLSKGGLAERLSYDHRGTDPAEIERIKSCGGIVIDGRVGGTLALTRAFGDHSLKIHGVLAKPFIKKHVLRSSDKFMIIASDGVWDSMEDQDAVNFCKEDASTKDIARSIVKSALDKGSKDNTSCLVIRFHPQF
jgi:serine/threonine protein phosphatase PrpC